MNIYESITGIMGEGYTIAKEKRNQQQGFMYRGIDDVMNVFQPLLSKYKVFVVPEVLEANREERVTNKGGTILYSILKIRYTFYAEDGSSVSAVVIGEGMDSGDKASNKALAVGMKYAMFQTFCIPTEEMVDPDATTPEPVKPKAEAPKAEKPKEEPPMFKCEICGTVLKPYKDNNGRTIGVRQHATGSQKAFGKVICIDCINSLHPDRIDG